MNKSSLHSLNKNDLQIQVRQPSYSHNQERNSHHHSFIKYPNDTSLNIGDDSIISTSKVANPTDKSNHFQAVSSLKQTEDQFQILKKRLQVLKIKDHKNNNRYHINQRRLIFHDCIQKIASQEKDKIQNWKQQNQQRVKQQKIQNLRQKLIHHRNIRSVIDTIKQTKSKDYSLRKQQQKNNQQKITQMSQQSFLSNKIKVQNIKRLEQFSKLSLEAHNKCKIAGYKEKQSKETDSLMMKKLKKQEEIKKMMELEMEMMQQQSYSRLIFERSTQRLREILNPQQNLKSSKNKKTSRTSEVSFEDQQTSKLNRNHAIETTQNSLFNGEIGKPSIHLTRQSSFNSQSPKKGISLPQIKNSRKYP